MVNSLFSGLAFAGIIITIYMQKEELKLQRKELKSTRKVFKKQSRLMKIQQNENTFFNLLENHRQLVGSFNKGKFKSTGKGGLNHFMGFTETISGYEVVARLAEEWIEIFSDYSLSIRSKIIVHPKGLNTGNGRERRNLFTNNPAKVISENDLAISLFNNIIHLYSFITSRFEVSDQLFYETILWNNLSKSEKFVFEAVLVNCPGLGRDIAHEIQEYQQYDFVNFQKEVLPTVEIKWPTKANTTWVIVESDFIVSNFKLFVYQQNYENGIVFEKIINVEVPLNIKSHSFLIEQVLQGTEYDLLITEKTEIPRNRKFAFGIDVTKENETYKVFGEIDARLKTANKHDDWSESVYATQLVQLISRDTIEGLLNLADLKMAEL
jgi:hypothetical protein